MKLKKFVFTKDQLYDLYIIRNLSANDIARLFNTSQKTVLNNLKVFNIYKNKEIINLQLKKQLLERWSNKEFKNKRSKETKLLWLDKKYRNRVIKNWSKSNNIKFNRPERKLFKLIKEVLPNQFKYSGDGKRVINGFIPDFIDNKNKRIIELYGDYWHSLPLALERNTRREKIYNNLGYKILIIWERELKDISSLRNKLLTFK